MLVWFAMIMSLSLCHVSNFWYKHKIMSGYEIMLCYFSFYVLKRVEEGKKCILWTTSSFPRKTTSKRKQATHRWSSSQRKQCILKRQKTKGIEYFWLIFSVKSTMRDVTKNSTLHGSLKTLSHHFICLMLYLKTVVKEQK